MKQGLGLGLGSERERGVSGFGGGGGGGAPSWHGGHLVSLKGGIPFLCVFNGGFDEGL